MNIRPAIVIAIAAFIAAPALAGGRDHIRTLADYTGLSESQVRTVLNGRTVMHTKYPQQFDRLESRFVEAIGKDNYDRLANGESITLRRDPEGTAVAVTATPKGD